MQGAWGELVALLEAEIAEYRRLVLMTRWERRPITQGEWTGIQEVAEQKERILREVVRLGEARRVLVGRLAGDQGEYDSASALARVANLAPGEARDALRRLLGEFRQVVARLAAAHEVNRTLLERSLEMVQSSLALFRTVCDPNPRYGPGGRVREFATAYSAVNQRA
jgi:flagellar biosynthesis/type III secretory pathway chaperone